MQRDVKVGLVLGVLLVAVVAVVFFRRDEEDRDKLAKLMPAPEQVADRARDMLGPSPTDPYPVAPEYLAESWQSPKPTKSVRTPTPQRNKPSDNAEPGADPETKAAAGKKDPSRTAAVLLPPETGPTRPPARSRLESIPAPSKSSSTEVAIRNGAVEHTIQEGETLSEIARQYMGHASAWSQIQEANPEVIFDPDNIPAGQKIRIPGSHQDDRPIAKTALPQPRLATATKSSDHRYETYVVQAGDTLISIAREHYRSGARFLDILHANQDQLREPRDLREGMVIRLPPGQAEW